MWVFLKHFLIYRHMESFDPFHWYNTKGGFPSLAESGNDQYLQGGKRKTSIFWSGNRNSVYERKRNLGKLQVGNRKKRIKPLKWSGKAEVATLGNPPHTMAQKSCDPLCSSNDSIPKKRLQNGPKLLIWFHGQVLFGNEKHPVQSCISG